MRDISKPLTRSQLLVWLGQQHSPATPLYNMVITFELPLALDVELFRQAFRDVVAECDALRSVFKEEFGQPSREVLDRLEFEFDLVDLSARADPEEAYAEWFNERRGVHIDLEFCAFDTVLLKLAPEKYIWYLNQHHIVTDGKSVSLVFDATAVRYQLLKEASECSIPESSQTESASAVGPLPSFEGYATYEQRLEDEGRIDRSRKHWQRQAELWQAQTAPSFYGHGQSDATTAGDRYLIDIGEERTHALRQLASKLQMGALGAEVALFQALLTLTFACLYRITGERVLVVGAPSANRANVKQRETVGLLMQVFSLRIELEENETFESLHRKVQTETMNFFRYSTPGAASLESARAFNMMLNYTKVLGPRLGDTPVKQRFHHSGHAEAHHWLRLQVQDFDDTGELLLELDLNRAAFGRVSGENSVGHFLSTLDAFLKAPELELSQYELLSLTEKKTLLEDFGEGVKGAIHQSTLNELVEAEASSHPDRLAVVSACSSLSYRELDQRSNQLANALSHAGVSDGSIVAIHLCRDVELIVAMLGVLKVGAAYMPVGVDLPEARKAFQLELAGVRVIVGSDPTEAELLPKDGTHIDICDLSKYSTSKPTASDSYSGQIDSPAYILFTSGSTGEPKGVVCPHRGVINLLDDFEANNQLPEACQVSWWTSATFDVSVYEIYAALTRGHTLHIAPELIRADGQRFLEWLCQKQIQSAWVPLFLLNEIRSLLEQGHNAPPLERLVVGVEPIAAETLESIASRLPKTQIVNGYGPTETTIFSSLYWLKGSAIPERNTPIGYPTKNTTISILDKHRNLVPAGGIGEIYIGGQGVTHGYLNRPQITAASFVENPFSSAEGAKLYKTGDSAYYLADGNIMFVGRGDGQIKLRGQRIEPGEIERTLMEHPAVRDTVVLVKEYRGSQQLVAYVVAHSADSILAADCSSWLEERLPRYMVPSAYILLESFPLTTSGKVDRGSLPSPEASNQLATASRPPESPLEHRLGEIFRKVLELDQVDVEAHFLDLGGDSISAMLIAASACEQQLNLLPHQIFEAKTIAALARTMEASSVTEADHASAVGKPVSDQEMAEVLAEFGEDFEDDL